uniref:MBD domain-containing protein n=1 Tax=Fundulus heteroclitus TaxID=8078 RepID=A0A3Q2Q4Y3_FUNHE
EPTLSILNLASFSDFNHIKRTSSTPAYEIPLTSCENELGITLDMDAQCNQEDLPHGWIREVKQRKAGKTAGKLDVYIISPSGQKFRSKASLHAYLLKNGGENADKNLFDFTLSKYNFTCLAAAAATTKLAPAK